MSHPGLVEPGPPGGERFLCPLCDWYLDVAPLDFEAPPRLRNLPADWSLIGIAEQLAREAREDVDAAIREHLVEAHTVPALLGTPPG